MILAVIVSLIGTIILNIGFVLQKSEAAQLPSFTPRNIKKKLYQVAQCRKWILGTTLTTTGWLFFLIAITMAPLTVIAPLSNAGVVILAGFAVFYLKESLHIYEWLGFIAILVGVIFIPLFASPLVNDITSIDYVLVYGITLICILILGVGKLAQRISFPLKNGAILGIASGVTAGLGSAYTKLLGLLGENIIFIIFILVMIAIFQILSFITLQTAFQQERATIIVPLFNSFATLLPLIYGVLVFSEVIPIGQLIGILLMVIGASALFQFSGEDFSLKLTEGK